MIMGQNVSYWGRTQNKAADFSISVFGRFTYTPYALNVHYLCRVSLAVSNFDNVRSYHTERS